MERQPDPLWDLHTSPMTVAVRVRQQLVEEGVDGVLIPSSARR